MPKPTQTITLRVSPELAELLRTFAFDLRVSQNALLSDVLQLWAAYFYDPTNTTHLREPTPEPPEERYLGYLESIDFKPRP
jgi:hypothetical protein